MPLQSIGGTSRSEVFCGKIAHLMVSSINRRISSMSWRGLSRAQIAEHKASFESEGPSYVYEEIQRRKSKPIDPQLFLMPSGVSEQTWVYENLRSLVCDLNFLIASLDGVCDITSCPLMTATPEWEYKWESSLCHITFAFFTFCCKVCCAQDRERLLRRWLHVSHHWWNFVRRCFISWFDSS